ncbi:unnamed protein product [Caenorhabditis brenneri]
MGLCLLEKVVNWYHEKYKKNEKELLTTLWTIGFGGVGFGAFLPKILLWFEGPNEMIQYYCFMIYPFMLAVLYFKFLYLFLSKARFFFRDTYFHAKLVCFFIFGHFYLLGVFGAISYIFFPNPDEKFDRNLAGYQMLMSMPAGIGTTECFLVAVGAIEWRKEEKAKGVNDSRIECKICLEEYSEERTARILKECGHTICHQCVINLMARNSNTHLFCPTCQQMTVTIGTAYSLRENRIVMSIVKKLKQ